MARVLDEIHSLLLACFLRRRSEFRKERDRHANTHPGRMDDNIDGLDSIGSWAEPEGWTAHEKDVWENITNSMNITDSLTQEVNLLKQEEASLETSSSSTTGQSARNHHSSWSSPIDDAWEDKAFHHTSSFDFTWWPILVSIAFLALMVLLICIKKRKRAAAQANTWRLRNGNYWQGTRAGQTQAQAQAAPVYVCGQPFSNGQPGNTINTIQQYAVGTPVDVIAGNHNTYYAGGQGQAQPPPAKEETTMASAPLYKVTL